MVPVRRFLLVPLLLAAAIAAEGDAPPTAEAVFRRAVESQGHLDARKIADVHLRFEGTIQEEGEHRIVREYWYRGSDRSFRIRTQPQAAKKEQTDRGVLGRGGFWERGPSGTVVELSPGNRDDRAVTKTIEKDRADFENALRLVLLAHLLEEKAEFRFAAEAPVRLPDDNPREARSILGDPSKREARYHVLDVVRPSEPRLRLFVREDDATIRKAILFSPEEPDRPDWIYYLGPYRRDPSTGLQVPQFLSLHDEEPLDDASRERGSKVWGTIGLKLNSGLGDDLFRGK